MDTAMKKIQQPDPSARYWRLPAVCAYTARSRSRIYADPNFPKPIKLGPNTSAWIAEEVRAWCAAREAASRKSGTERIPYPVCAAREAASRKVAAGTGTATATATGNGVATVTGARATSATGTVTAGGRGASSVTGVAA